MGRDELAVAARVQGGPQCRARQYTGCGRPAELVGSNTVSNQPGVASLGSHTLLTTLILNTTYHTYISHAYMPH